MNKGTALKYEKIQFNPELINMFSEIISLDNYTTLQVFSLIFRKSLNISEQKDPMMNLGITKKEIMETTKVYSKKKIDDKFIDAEIQMTKKNCDDIINFLLGATLIYYDEKHREKPFLLTIRGKQLAAHLIQKGIMENPINKRGL